MLKGFKEISNSHRKFLSYLISRKLVDKSDERIFENVMTYGIYARDGYIQETLNEYRKNFKEVYNEYKKNN